jgi:hypothetical protein
MSKKSDFDNILDECLTRVLKGETVEACLASFPEHGGELEPLLRTALDARAAAVIRPRREFRERAAYEFQAAIREMPAKESVGPVFWHRRWVTALAAVVIVLLAGTGVVAASSGSLPDGPLYGVKLATETVRIALTPSDVGKAELYVKFTNRRVDEIIAMADEGKVDQVDRVTERLDSQMIAMAGVTAAEAASTPTYSTAETAPQPMLAAPAPTTTVASTTVPAATSTTTTPARTTTAVPGTVTTPPVTVTNTPPPTVVAAPPPAAINNAPDHDTGLKRAPPPQAASGEQNSEAVPDGQAKLRELLASSAAANSEALEAELAKAPESVRPALERAIEIANLGYEQALSNLGQ